MPWTPKQTRYLLSSVSPLSSQQKNKMKAELHGNPSLAHAKKGGTMGNWMKKVSSGIKHRGTRGVFKAAAQRAGKSTSEFAQEHKHDSGKTGRRARLALAYTSSKH